MKKSIKSLKICVPVREKTQERVLKRLEEIKARLRRADMAEIWLDHIENLNITGLLQKKPLPVICVCKKPADKGKFKGTYAEMAEILIEAMRHGADYIDIPLAMTNDQCPMTNLRKSLIANRKSKIIISYHNFIKTPSIKKMLEIAEEMKKLGADIVKIAVMAKTLDDTFAVILLAQQLQAKKIPHILIAMGKKGILSRVLTPFLGGTIMFAPLTAKGASATGQLTVKELRKAWELIKI